MRPFERIRSALSRASEEVHDPTEVPPLEGAMAGPPASPPADPQEEFAWLDVDDPLDLPRIVGLRAGVYLITDSKGRRLGTIRGDFGIGFTVHYRQTSGWYDSLDAAQVALATQAVGRPASLEPGASAEAARQAG